MNEALNIINSTFEGLMQQTFHAWCVDWAFMAKNFPWKIVFLMFVAYKIGQWTAKY